MIDRRYVATVLVILSLVTLTPGAYAGFPIPPPKQAFDKSGFIYTVEYECGSLEGDYSYALAGSYRTAIMIHNPTDRNQTFAIKYLSLLSTGGTGGIGAVWDEFTYLLQPDGALELDCSEILSYVGGDYSTGFVIISHPLLRAPKVPLDVIVAYTYQSPYGGAGKDVERIPGVYVSKVPIPPIKPPT